MVFLQTIEHIHDPDRLLERIARSAPVAYISTPNRLTLAPPGAEKSDNPWHLREYDQRQYRELLEPHFEQVELLGLFHARKLRAHELAIRLGWDRVHPALHLTKPFYDRFIPAIRAGGLPPAGRRPRSRAGLRRGLSACLSGPPAISRSSSTPTCPTSRGSAPTRSARSGSSTPSPARTCRCWTSPSG